MGPTTTTILSDEGIPLKVGMLGQSTICKSKVVSTKACVPLVLAESITGWFSMSPSPTRFRSRVRFGLGFVQPTSDWPPI